MYDDLNEVDHDAKVFVKLAQRYRFYHDEILVCSQTSRAQFKDAFRALN